MLTWDEMYEKSVADGLQPSTDGQGPVHMTATSFDDLSSRIRSAWPATYSGAESVVDKEYEYVIEVFPSYVIVDKAGKLFRCGYVVDADGNVTFGSEKIPVRREYVPIGDNEG